MSRLGLGLVAAFVLLIGGYALSQQPLGEPIPGVLVRDPLVPVQVDVVPAPGFRLPAAQQARSAAQQARFVEDAMREELVELMRERVKNLSPEDLRQEVYRHRQMRYAGELEKMTEELPANSFAAKKASLAAEVLRAENEAGLNGVIDSHRPQVGVGVHPDATTLDATTPDTTVTEPPRGNP